MLHARWLGIALSLGLLTGCPGGLNLGPQTMDQINALLGEYGLSLKSVDPSTGKAIAYGEGDIAQVVGEDGKPIPYKFEKGKLVFRPLKQGPQRIFVHFKDGTRQQFTIEGKQVDGRLEGDVAFIPDGSGQGYTSEVGIGKQLDPEGLHQTYLDLMAAKRVALTFSGVSLPGLKADNLRAVYFDRMKLPPFTYHVADGTLKIDPQHFFMAREYQKRNGDYPLVRLVQQTPSGLSVVLAAMSGLPKLPAFEPAKPGEPPPPPPLPQDFESGQTLDLLVKLTEELPGKTVEQYEEERGLQTNVPKPGDAPPPPNQSEQSQIADQVNEYAVAFPLSALAGLKVSDVKAMFVGKMERPFAPSEPNKPPRLLDLVAIDEAGVLKLDSMMVGHAFQLWYGPLNQSLTEYPWIRLYYQKDGGHRLLAFRFQANAGPDWFRTPDAVGWSAPSRLNIADWMPPPPPVGSFGKGQELKVGDLQVFDTRADQPDDSTLDLFRHKLRGMTGPNPAPDIPE